MLLTGVGWFTIACLSRCNSSMLICDCRAMLLSKWWSACSQILAKGKVKARQLEERLWVERRMAVKVSPAMHIMDQYGRVVHPEDIDLELPVA